MENRRTYTLGNVLARKDPKLVIAEIDSSSDERKLRRSVSAVQLMAYGIGATVGAGIFVTTGVIARRDAGPALFLSYIIAAIAAAVSGLCYAEFAAKLPVAGSAYIYTYTAVGELLAWFVGWNLTLEYALSASAIARGWSGYLVQFFQSVNVTVPQEIYNVSGGPSASFSFSPLSVMIVLACTLALLLGVSSSARINLVLTVLNVSAIIFIIIYGGTLVDPSNWSNMFPYGFNGVIKGAATTFFSFVGFDTVTVLAEESKNPQRDLPLGIIGSLTMITFLYVGVCLVITGMVPYNTLSLTAPLAEAFFTHGKVWVSILIALISVTTLSSGTLCSLLGQPRIYYRMAKDGLFFKAFGKLSSRQVPVLGTIVTGVLAASIAFFFDIGALADTISIGTLLAFALVNGSIIVLRQEKARSISWRPVLPFCLILFALGSTSFSICIKYAGPTWCIILLGVAVIIIPGIGTGIYCWKHQRREERSKNSGFFCPFVPMTPLVGIFFNLYLAASLDPAAWIRLVAWTGAGLVVYFAYGIRHSTLRHKDTSLLDASETGSEVKTEAGVVISSVDYGLLQTPRTK